MPQLTDLENGTVIGNINDDELVFLNENRDGYLYDSSIYYVNRTYLEELLKENKHQEFIHLLLGSLGDRDEMDIKSSIAIDPDSGFNWLNPVSAVFLLGLALVFAISLLFGLLMIFEGHFEGLLAPFAITFSFIRMLLLPGLVFAEFHLLVLLISIICFFISSLLQKSTTVTISNIIGAISTFLLLIFGLINTLARGLAVY